MRNLELQATLESHDISIDNPLLVVEFQNTSQLPSNFRRSDDPYANCDGPLPTRSGLERLRASAARQFSGLDLATTLKRLSGRVSVVDLRQEPHGFIDGDPVSWYGLRNWTYAEKSGEEIEELERSLISQLNAAAEAEVHSITHKTGGCIDQSLAQTIPVERAETERELLERLGIEYVRFFVTDHHHPNPRCVDEFIRLVRGREEDSWLHFHCRSGLGRTSTFMVLNDIILNAQTVSLDDIIRRHDLLGSKNLFQVSESKDKLWRYHLGAERRTFLKEFYAYMRHQDEDEGPSWREWVEAGETSSPLT